jgi:hypothetical protein
MNRYTSSSRLFTVYALILILTVGYVPFTRSINAQAPKTNAEKTSQQPSDATGSMPKELNTPAGASSKLKTEPENKSQIVYAPHWSTEDGFTTTIYIRNVQIDRPITVHVSLLIKNRTIILPKTNIASLQTLEIDVARALARQGERAEQYGGAVIDFKAQSAGAVNAYAHMLDNTRSLSLSFPFMTTGANSSGPLESVAWFYNKDTKAFVALQNTTKKAVSTTPTLFVAEKAIKLKVIRLKPSETVTIEIPRLGSPENQDGPGSTGVRFEYDGAAWSIVIQGWVIDEQRGLSAPISFRPKATCPCPDGIRHMYGTGIPIGASGMMSMMSPGKVFSPYLAVSNSSEAALTLNPVLNYMSGGRGENLTLPQVRLSPRENKLINLKDLQDQGVIPQWVGDANIDLQYEGEAGALLAELNSVDQNGSFVSPVPLTCYGNGNQYMVFWRTDGDWHSDIVLQNTDSEETNVELTISYTGGIYVFNRQLAPGETAAVSINELQQGQLPDATGRRLPLNAAVGGVNLFSSSNSNGLLMNAMIFNPVTGTCAGCGSTAYVQSFGQVESYVNTFKTDFETHQVGDQFIVKYIMKMSDQTTRYDSAMGVTNHNAGICTVSSGSTLTCNNPGTTYITSSSQGTWYTDSSCNFVSRLYGHGLLPVIKIDIKQDGTV